MHEHGDHCLLLATLRYISPRKMSDKKTPTNVLEQSAKKKNRAEAAACKIALTSPPTTRLSQKAATRSSAHKNINLFSRRQNCKGPGSPHSFRASNGKKLAEVCRTHIKLRLSRRLSPQAVSVRSINLRRVLQYQDQSSSVTTSNLSQPSIPGDQVAPGKLAVYSRHHPPRMSPVADGRLDHGRSHS